MNGFTPFFVSGLAFIGSLAVAQVPQRPNWYESFESGSPTWQVLHSENRGSVVEQQRTKEVARRGTASETIRFRLPKESCVLVGHSLGFPLTIPDLLPSVTIKSTQPGVTVALQIVLPNSIHPETGQPVSYLVVGSTYSGSGEWETLGFWSNPGEPTLLNQIDNISRLLRAEMKINLDLRDRYVRQIVLFVEGNQPHTTEMTVWIDSLDVVGHVVAHRETLQQFESTTPYRFDPINFNALLLQASRRDLYVLPHRAANLGGGYTVHPTISQGPGGPLRASPNSSGERGLYSGSSTVPYRLMHGITPSTATIRLSDRVLYINDVPVGVRAIEYRGEPLAFLRELQFNAVWLNGRATPELLKEAQAADIWLICAPPSSLELRGPTVSPVGSPNDARSIATYPRIDPIYDNVLAWNIGDDCTNPKFKEKALWVADLQSADRGRRPILCMANSGVREYSRICDILLMRRDPLLSSLDLNAAGKWMQNYRLLALPNKQFWSTIQTQPDPRVANQWTLFGVNPQETCAVSYEQLQLQVYQALAAGVHGVLFTSNTPLTNIDPETEYRRKALELMNWNLQLINEWFAAGVVDPTPIRSNRREMAYTVLKAGRTRLLIPQWTEPNNQFAVGAAVVGDVKYIVPGVPETFSAFHLVPGHLYPLDAPRVAGGKQVTLEEANLNSLIYFGEADATFGIIGTRATLIGPRAALLACQLAELQLAASEKILTATKQANEFKAIPMNLRDSLYQEQESLLRMTQEGINLAIQATQQNPPSYASAYLQAERATRGLRVTARELLQNTTRHEPHLCLTPVSVSFTTVPSYLALYNRVSGGTPGPHLLPAGDMENLNLWQQAGWRSELHQVSDIAVPAVSIAPGGKPPGKYALLMSVKPLPGEEPPPQLETSPVWITSPPMRVRMGELLCVSGWIKIPKNLESGVDGLMIYDSFGGEALALRFTKKTNDWQEFVFYRYAPLDGLFFLYFSLFAIGDVYIDDVSVWAVQLPPPAVAPPTPQPQPLLQRLNPLPYIPNLLPGRNP